MRIRAVATSAGRLGALPPDLLTVALIVFVGAATQAITGFGFALTVVPLLTFVLDTKDAVATSLLLASITSLFQAVHERDHRNGPIARRLVIGAALGAPFGLVVLQMVSDDTLRVILAATVLVFVALLAANFRIHSTSPAIDVGAGALSGLLNTSIATNGPPLVVVLSARGLEPKTFRATISLVFACSNILGLVLLTGAGRLNGDVAHAALWGAPGLALGWWAGFRVRPHVEQRWFRPLVLLLLSLTAVSALVSALR
jgi:uncharacterized membrane protein YfcA